MKTRIFLVAAALLMLASLSFGQNFIACLYSANPDGSSHPLFANCDGSGGPLPDGTVITIWWDANGNGPDATDVQPTVGQDNGNVNFNSFTINSGLGDPGTFATDPCFTSVGSTPTVARYYLKLACPNGVDHYVSAVFTVAVGPQDVYIYQWTCVPCVAACTPTPAVTFYRHPVPAYSCVHLCQGSTTVIYVCADPGSPPLDPTKTPIVSVVPGCIGNGCQEDCAPGQFIFNPAGWVYDPATGCFYNVLIGVADNTCACVQLTGFLAAGIDNFTGTAADNSVALTWTSASETNVLSYSLIRDGHTVASIPAVNSPSGHTYNYVDRTAVNGTTYTYGLRIVNSDNSVTDVDQQVTATPSFSAAVVTEYALLQNFPNPFNPSTEIAFDVLNSNPVTLKVYNANGQVVATLVNGATYEGGKRYVVNFDASNLTSGLYFYTVKIGNEFSATKKMLLVK